MDKPDNELSDKQNQFVEFLEKASSQNSVTSDNNSIKEMERAVELRPEDPVLNDHLGDALWRVGRKLEASYQWKRVLTLKPEKKLSTQVKQKLIDGLPNIAKKNN